MLSETVRISSVESGFIRLQPYSNSTCSSCSLKPSCGQYLLNSLHANRAIEFPINLLPEVDIHLLKKGSQAQIKIEESKLLQLVLLMYLFPLFSMLLAAYLTWLVGLNEIAVMISVSSALILSMKVLSLYFRSHGKLEKIKLCLLSADDDVIKQFGN